MLIYNSLTRKREEFIPNVAGKVNMYTCGPTVYHYAHIGNLRSYIMEDVLEKYLRYTGLDVTRVMNITDVGHLTDDSDDGEDKMEKAAKEQKKDEFFTQIGDIERELRHYKEHFKDKVVFCNCDDPYESNFFKYFALNFNALGLKKLIATCYDPSPIAGQQLNLFEDNNIEVKEKKAYKIEIEEILDANGDGSINLTDVEILLKNNKNVIFITPS